MSWALDLDYNLVVGALSKPPYERTEAEVNCIFAVIHTKEPFCSWKTCHIRDVCQIASYKAVSKDFIFQLAGSERPSCYLLLSGSVFYNNSTVINEGSSFGFEHMEGSPLSTAFSLEQCQVAEFPRVLMADCLFTEEVMGAAPPRIPARRLSVRSKALLAFPPNADPWESFVSLDGDSDDESATRMEHGPEAPPPPRPAIPFPFMAGEMVVYDTDCQEYVSSTGRSLLYDPHDSDNEDEDDAYYDAMTATSPAVLGEADRVRVVLEKHPHSRTSEDLALLLLELKNLSIFAFQSASLNERIFSLMEVVSYSAENINVFENSSSANYWCVVLTGSIALQFPGSDLPPKTIVEGEAFGLSLNPPPSSLPSSVSPIYLTQASHCQIGKIEKSLYEKALKEDEKNLSHVEDEGKTVLVTEQRLISNEPPRVVVTRGSKEMLINVLLGKYAPKGKEGVVISSDPDYMHDYLMTYRIFDDGLLLASTILSTLNESELRQGVLNVLLTWVSNYFCDFEDTPALMTLLGEIETKMDQIVVNEPVYIPIVSKIKAQRDLHSKPRIVTLEKSTDDEELGFSIRGGADYGCPIYIAQVFEGTKASEYGLRVADQILEVNGADFSNVLIRQAIRTLKEAHRIIMRVKYNAHGYRESLFVPSPNTIRKKRSAETLSKSSLPPAEDEKGKPRNRVGSLGSLDKKKTDKGGKWKGIIKKFGLNQKGDGVAAYLERIQTEFDSSVHDSLRVYRADQSFRHIAVLPETTAREVCDLLGILWGIADYGEHPEHYSLCEVSVQPGGLVKQTTLRDNVDSLASSLSIYGRYYLKSNTAFENLLPDEAKDELEKKSSHLSLLSFESDDLAKHLMLKSGELFTNIEPLEYIGFIWASKLKIAHHNLEALTRRFNHLTLWVQTEMCSHPPIRTRLAVLKQFIKVAKCCEEQGDFFSMMAIMSGLCAAPVSRLKQTWERLSQKYTLMYSDMEQIMNPSRNMANYRTLFRSAIESPPAIPFFPLLMKDLTFIHEGNETMIEGLVNFDKMRMLAKELKQINTNRLSNMEATSQLLKDKKDLTLRGDWIRSQLKRKILHYLDHLKVENVVPVLDKMSEQCEARRGSRAQGSSLSLVSSSTTNTNSSTPSLNTPTLTSTNMSSNSSNISLQGSPSASRHQNDAPKLPRHTSSPSLPPSTPSPKLVGKFSSLHDGHSPAAKPPRPPPPSTPSPTTTRKQLTNPSSSSPVPMMPSLNDASSSTRSPLRDVKELRTDEEDLAVLERTPSLQLPSRLAMSSLASDPAFNPSRSLPNLKHKDRGSMKDMLALFDEASDATITPAPKGNDVESELSDVSFLTQAPPRTPLDTASVDRTVDTQSPDFTLTSPPQPEFGHDEIDSDGSPIGSPLSRSFEHGALRLLPSINEKSEGTASSESLSKLDADLASHVKLGSQQGAILSSSNTFKNEEVHLDDSNGVSVPVLKILESPPRGFPKLSLDSHASNMSLNTSDTEGVLRLLDESLANESVVDEGEDVRTVRGDLDQRLQASVPRVSHVSDDLESTDTYDLDIPPPPPPLSDPPDELPSLPAPFGFGGVALPDVIPEEDA